jgi:hypothetical protein
MSLPPSRAHLRIDQRIECAQHSPAKPERCERVKRLYKFPQHHGLAFAYADQRPRLLDRQCAVLHETAKVGGFVCGISFMRYGPAAHRAVN